jgi:CDP-paratose synthetase
MNVLLTGATGFLGSHILRKLLERGYNLIILKRSISNTWRIANLLDKVKVYDIDKVGIEKPFEENRIDIVIHTATNYGRNKESASDVVETNLLFSLKLLETATFYNTDTFFNTDTLLYKYLNFYSLSKKQFVEWLKYFSNKIQVVNLKLEHVYGPKDDDKKFVTWVVRQLIKNVDFIDLTEGDQERDFIYVDDVVDAYLLLIEKAKCLEDDYTEFDVGTGKPIKIRDFIYKVYETVAKKQPIKTRLNFGAIPYREGEFMKINENIQPLLDLGWSPKIPLEKGIQILVEEELKWNQQKS